MRASIISLRKCTPLADLVLHKNSQLESLEALTARFERLSDIILHKLLKTIDYLDLDKSPSIRHILLRSEKKGIIKDHKLFFKIRELRNVIAHDYVGEQISTVLKAIIQLTPLLLEVLEDINTYVQSDQ